MIHKHSLSGRIITSLITGFVIGGIVHYTLAYWGARFDTYFTIGLWLFYLPMSMTIALMGMLSHHPIFGFPISWWLRGFVIGTIYHLLLVMLSYGAMYQITIMPKAAAFGLISPGNIIVYGAFIGMIISGIVTKINGEGERLPIE
jgi:hypothetical protein